MDEDSDDDEDEDDDDNEASSWMTNKPPPPHPKPTFLQHLVHQQATFLQVKQGLKTSKPPDPQASINATDDSHLCVVCMDEERGVLYVPCNHLAVCVGCEDMVERSIDCCPMCQEPIDRSRSISGIVVS